VSAGRAGIDVREGTAAALARSTGGSGFEVALGGAGGERLTGREVVVTAGAWSGEILRAAGLAPAAPLEPVRGQMLECPSAMPFSTILNHGDVYLIPRPGGTVWVGATVEDAGFDERTTPEGLAALLSAARKPLPDLGEPLRAWAGLRPRLLRRGGPLLGEGEPPVLAGHYRSGIHLGPLTAHLVASRIAGEREPDLAPFTFE
jgi:glycine oxidase